MSAEYRVESPDAGSHDHHGDDDGEPHGAPCAGRIERPVLAVVRLISVVMFMRHSDRIYNLI